jgi:hypothetical protein
MSKIYLVSADVFDGECSYLDPIKAFKNKTKAGEFADGCTKETQRIRKEVDEHNKKYEEELKDIGNKLRDKILKNGRLKRPKVIDFNKEPESIRRIEIMDEETAIRRSHKYHHDLLDVYDEIAYNIIELELV